MIFACMLSLAAQAQQLSLDPKVKYGVLPNGLTYYVRHNEEPKGQAEFYIAQAVGSMQEEDEQSGLAHFLEHMCFNGTAHFPGKTMIDYLESIGVRYGVNLNAYTSFDETVYNISSVPVTRDGIVDSCLLILHDWSHDLLLEDKEIDDERGVIHEEWRGADANRRIFTNILPMLFPNGSRYGNRMPIGRMEVVDNFPYEALRAYYRKWYRPDLQAIVIVGDIDADNVVEKINTLFADIEMPKNAAKREYLPVEPNSEPIIARVSDPELTHSQFMLSFRHEPMTREQRNTPDYYVNSYITSAAQRMFSMRIAELMQQANPPFLGCSLSDNDYFVSKTSAATSLLVVYADGGFDTAVKAGLREFMRATRYGFTQSEYERFRANFLEMLDNMWTEREKTRSGSYVDEYVRHFLDGNPAAGIDVEYPMMKQIAESVSVDAINEWMGQIVRDENISIALMLTEKEMLQTPSNDKMMQYVIDAAHEDIALYEDKVVNEPLMETRPTEGRIVKKSNGMFGSTVYTLNNGIRMIVLATDYAKDEIRVSGLREGGTSLFDDTEILQLPWISKLHSVMGLDRFSRMDLTKVLTGRTASASAGVSGFTDNIGGSSTCRDFETMLQLITLQFRPQRIDQTAFESFSQRTRQAMQNDDAEPSNQLRDSIMFYNNTNTVRSMRLKANHVDSINMMRVAEMYNSRFDHADNFTFFMVGNIDNDSLINLAATYLGALPVKGVKDKAINRHNTYRKGKYVCHFDRKLETPKTMCTIFEHAEIKSTLHNALVIEFLEQALSNSLTTRMREELGATYSPQASASLSIDYFGNDRATIAVMFECARENRDALIKIAHEEIARLAAEGVSDEQMERTRQNVAKEHADNLRSNGYYMGLMQNYHLYKLNMYKDYIKTLNSVTSADVKKLCKKILKQNNEVIVSMNPELSEIAE